MSSKSQEVAVLGCYAALYLLRDGKWEISTDLDGPMTEVYLFHDSSDNTYRLIGWIVHPNGEQQVVVNANITRHCVYTKRSDLFHKLTDEYGCVHGIAFYEVENVENIAQEMFSLVNSIIDDIRASSEEKRKSLDELKTFDDKDGIDVPHLHETLNSAKRLKNNASAAPKTGEMTIGIPKPARRTSGGKTQISDPTKVVRETHVKYDPVTRTFTGIPDEWKKHLSKQFGVSLKLVECVQLPEYISPIPKVLVVLKQFLFENGGFKEEGIFRLAPDSIDSNKAKRQLDEGNYEAIHDCNVVANLIKVYFRELPVQILGKIPAQRIINCEEEKDCDEILEIFEEPEKSVYLWLLDLCIEVAYYKNENRMGVKNLAIVIAPNLFVATDDVSPMQSMILSQKYVQFMTMSIAWRSAQYQ